MWPSCFLVRPPPPAVVPQMSGFFQTTFYFGYMLMFCAGLGLMTGTLGYCGCNVFVRRIYKNIKSD